MQTTPLVVLILCAFGTTLTLLNSFTMRVVKDRKVPTISHSISVLVPMRNEEKNVDGLVSAIQKSDGLAHWEFTVLDDASTDNTFTKLKALNVNTLRGELLPEGWLGKTWACHQLAQTSQSIYLVFIDADVRVHPRAIASSISIMDQLKWDFISPHPRQIAVTFLERLFQPLLQWSWLASVPLRIAERFGVKSMTIANGQFFIVKSSAYRAIGGHESIKSEVLDDLQLARKLVDGGFKGGVAEASAIAETRMYSSAKEIIDGYTKSLWTAFGGLFGTLIAMALIVTTQILPLLLGISGSSIGWVAYLVTAASHAIAALRTKSAPANIFMHPLSAFLLIGLIIESLRRKNRGELVWRERTLN